MARIDNLAFELGTDEYLARVGPDAVPWQVVMADPAGSVGTTTNAPKTGARSFYARIDDAWSYIHNSAVFAGSPDEIWCAFHYWIENYGQELNRRTVAMIYTDGNDMTFVCRPNQTAYMTFSGVTYYTTSNIAMETWVHVELHLKIHATLGEVHVYINGVEEISAEGIDTTGGGATLVQYFAIGCDDLINNARIENRFDNVIINDNTGSEDNGRIGVRYLEPVIPNADGDEVDWSLFPDGGEDQYQDVDELVPDDDTTYLFHDVDGEQFLNELADWDATDKNPQAVIVTAVAKRDGGTAADAISLIAKSGAVTAKSDVIELADGTYNMYVYRLTEDPDGGSIPWGEAGIDALQVGAEIVNV